MTIRKPVDAFIEALVKEYGPLYAKEIDDFAVQGMDSFVLRESIRHLTQRGVLDFDKDMKLVHRDSTKKEYKRKSDPNNGYTG